MPDTKNKPAVQFAALCLIVLLGIINLPEYFHGDQALFTVYASAIDQGSLLYRDVWDIKQPAIFIFYYSAGKIFGFNENGIHLFELFYWLAFSVVLQATLKNYFIHKAFAKIAPLITVGVYYAVCRSLHLTQVEGLIGFPLYLTLWTADRTLHANSKAKQFYLLFLSGFFGGVILMFKLIFLPLILLFWLIFLVFLSRNKRIILKGIISASVLPVISGTIIFPALITIYFARHDALPLVFYTFFEYPWRAALEVNLANRTEVLKNGIRWFVSNFFPLICLAAAGFFVRLADIYKRKRPLRTVIAEIDFFTAGLIVWIFGGLGVILSQRLSWWEYHYLLLFVPLGILSLKSLELIYEKVIRTNRTFSKPTIKAIFVLCIFGLCAVFLKQIAVKVKNRYDEFAKIGENQAFVYQDDFLTRYRIIKKESREISIENPSDKIFVLGHPLYYYHLNRLPAINTNGWMPEMFLEKQWREMNAQIETVKPRYIFIERSVYPLLSEKSPETMRLLEKFYRLQSKGENTDFYKLESLN